MGTDKPEAFMHSVLALMALQALPRVGPKTALRCALDMARWDEVLEQRAGQWEPALDAAEARLVASEQRGIMALSFFDDRYPERLRAIADPPPVLYVRGALDAISMRRSAAVVGTREPTSFGRTAAEELTSALASADWAIVSGLAKGIDTLAHRTALERGTPTIAVMAGGLDSVYPAENRGLADAIVEQGGALVSEQPIGSQPRAASFVGRNRIQTALSAAVLVIQTGLKGGTMHTARHAVMQGRPVFCPRPHTPHERNAGLYALLDRPGAELAGLLPAWRDAGALSERLGDRRVARPISRDELPQFLATLERSLEESQTTPEEPWWPLEAVHTRDRVRDALLFGFAG
jgi:DNA processing protein